MSNKTAYVWGPISNFSGCLLSLLLENGWHLHIASKSALQISLSPLDLTSTAQNNIEKAAGGAEKLKPYRGKLVFLESDEPRRGITYDAVLFMGLPSNFDEPRVSRAPWAADELSRLTGKLKDVPVFILSSLWGGIQNDGAVPEEIEFERRKPYSQFEAVCQQYEIRILKAINKEDCKWHLLRLPLILGGSVDGRSVNFTGLYKLLQELYLDRYRVSESSEKIDTALNYNPDATFWMLPCDWAAHLVVKIIEDNMRPVICNVVSTQATLNQEWLQELARALGLDSLPACERDGLNLPPTLRSMLKDNIQVKTHNLFEVLGRYQQAPLMLSSDYFRKVLNYAEVHNWGQPRAGAPEPLFSADKARTFFEVFMPSRLDENMLTMLATFKGGLAFQIAGENDCRWLVNGLDGKVQVQPLSEIEHKPQVSFLVGAQSFVKLAAGKMLLETAMLTRGLQVSGNPLQILRACDFFRRFLQMHHFSFAD